MKKLLKRSTPFEPDALSFEISEMFSELNAATDTHPERGSLRGYSTWGLIRQLCADDRGRYSHEKYLENKKEVSALSRAWAIANAEYVRAYKREWIKRWRRQNPAKAKAARKKYLQAHPEYVKRRYLRYKAKYREQILARGAAYRRVPGYRERVNAYLREWKKTPAARAIQIRYRIRHAEKLRLKSKERYHNENPQQRARRNYLRRVRRRILKPPETPEQRSVRGRKAAMARWSKRR